MVIIEADHDNDQEVIGVWERQLCSRFLYPNPVVLLSTASADFTVHNLMTLTWLTPVNNRAELIASINRSRYSAELLAENKRFVLNVAVQSIEEKVVAIGSYSGRIVTDKFQQTGLTPCFPGWATDYDEFVKGMSKSGRLSESNRKKEVLNQYREIWAVRQCSSHLLCSWSRMEPNDDHFLLFATIHCVFTKEIYWNKKTVRSPFDDPIMAFLGSHTFGFSSIRHGVVISICEHI